MSKSKRKKKPSKKKGPTKRKPVVREPSNQEVNIYLQWVLFAVYGMLGYADGMIRQHGDVIRRVAAWLRAVMPVKPGTVYRGLLLDPSLLRASDGLVEVDPNYTFLSYTEDKDVACWFADRESTISKSVAERYAEASGYIAKRSPRQDEILFHYSWGLGFPLAGRRIPLWIIATQDPRMDAGQIEQWLKTQQEVILEPVTEPYPVTPFEDECPSDPAVLEDLDRRLTGRQFAHEVKKRKWDEVGGGLYVKKRKKNPHGGAPVAAYREAMDAFLAEAVVVLADAEATWDLEPAARPPAFEAVHTRILALEDRYERVRSLFRSTLWKSGLRQSGLLSIAGNQSRGAEYLESARLNAVRAQVGRRRTRKVAESLGAAVRLNQAVLKVLDTLTPGRNPRGKQIPTDYESPVYHVTYSGRLPLIAEHGLQPDRGPSMGEKYETHRKGAVFLTDPDGISFWHERAEEWALHRADDLLAEGVVPVVLRAWTDVPCELDEIGSHDANAPAWKCLGVVPPAELELWSGDRWVPVTDYEEVDFSRAVDEEGYLAAYSENELVPTAADMSFAAKVNPPRRPSRRTASTRAQTRAKRRATQRARLRRLLRTI